MSKKEYAIQATRGLAGGSKLFEMALVFWHSEVPLEDAKRYLKVLSRKLK